MPPHKKRRIEHHEIPQISPMNEDDVISEDNSSQASDVSPESGRPANMNTGQQTSNGQNSKLTRTQDALLPRGGLQSSMLHLQIDELLTTVRPDYERRMKFAENALRKLKAIMEHIPPREAQAVRLSFIIVAIAANSDDLGIDIHSCA